MKSEVEIFLGYINRHLAERTNIKEGLEEARKNPGIISATITGLNKAITSLNEFIAKPQSVTDSKKELLPNSTLIREDLRYMLPDDCEIRLPTLSELAASRDSFTLSYARQAFEDANGWMALGDHYEYVGWQFHKSLTGPARLSDALGLEIYTLFISKPFPELHGREKQVMLALEEMLALYHQDQRMFTSIRGWISEEEGFSRSLVKNLTHPEKIY